MNLLAGDLGGTKTDLRLFTSSGDVLSERRYLSEEHDNFDEILHDFLEGKGADAACFAVAGPVIRTSAEVTNLGWNLDARSLAKRHRLGKVRLVNDFFGVAASLGSLTPDDLHVVKPGEPGEWEPRAVIGAGTGLGEAIVASSAGRWTIVPGEGGHCDFAPANELQDELLRHLRRKYGHVSWERIVSGLGIVDLHAFFLERAGRGATSVEKASVVAALAEQGDREAVATLDLFFEAYGAEAGNLALRTLARGGVYLAGGIAAKHVDRLKGDFLRAFVAKGRFEEVMQTIPVYLITHPNAGLIGAATLVQEPSPAVAE